MNLNKSSCWLSSSLAATVLPWQSNISLMMIDFLCNLGASFFLLPSNFDSLYSLLFIVGLLSLFFLVVSATLGSSMSPFRPSDQFLLCWWNWGFTSNWKSYLNISYCFLLLVELSVSTSWLESCLLISCFFPAAKYHQVHSIIDPSCWHSYPDLKLMIESVLLIIILLF